MEELKFGLSADRRAVFNRLIFLILGRLHLGIYLKEVLL